MLIIILIFQNSVLYILDIFSTTNLLFKITSLLPSLSLFQSPSSPPLRIQFHTRERNQRITPANFFFLQSVSIREGRFRPYKIPSGQLRSPSEIRNEPSSKNPPHFITTFIPSPNFLFSRRRRVFEEQEQLGIFHRSSIITSSSSSEFPLTERKTESWKSFRIHFHSATRALEGFTQFLPNYTRAGRARA